MNVKNSTLSHKNSYQKKGEETGRWDPAKRNKLQLGRLPVRYMLPKP